MLFFDREQCSKVLKEAFVVVVVLIIKILRLIILPSTWAPMGILTIKSGLTLLLEFTLNATSIKFFDKGEIPVMDF